MELVVAVGLLGLLGGILAQVNVDFLNGFRKIKAPLARDQALILIREASGSINNLRVSMKKPENAAFHDCVCGGGGGCKSYDGDQSHFTPFTLYDSNGTAITPMYFDADGFKCDPSQSSCLFVVTTKFQGECLPDLTSGSGNPPPTCNTPAEFILINYFVTQNPASQGVAQYYKTISGAVYSQVSDINTPTSGVCP